MKESFGRHNKQDKVSDEVGLTVPEPRADEVDLSAKVTAVGYTWD